MLKIDKNVFLEGLDNGFFKAPNDIFDLEFKVVAEKRVVKKVGGETKYEYIETVRNLDAVEKLVYLYICRCANNGRSAFPSYRNIAQKCNISLDKATKSINVLVNNCFIQKKTRGGQGERMLKYSNVYNINADLKALQKALLEVQ